MTLKFTLFSQEVEDFVLEIQIDADARFSELHQLILKACGYTEHPGQLFIVCDEDWHPTQRVRLTDAATASDEDVYLMDDTSLSEFVEEEGQHVAYRFDPEDKRHFLLDVSECLYGKSCDEAVVLRRHGVAPDQFLFDEEPTPVPVVTPAPVADEPEEADDEEGFEADELDMEGFEIGEE